MNDTVRLMFAQAKVRRLERELAELTEARDAVAAGSQWLRGELDRVTNRLETSRREVAMFESLFNHTWKQRDEYLTVLQSLSTIEVTDPNSPDGYALAAVKALVAKITDEEVEQRR